MNGLCSAYLISFFATLDVIVNYTSKFMLCNIPTQYYLQNGLYFASSDVTMEWKARGKIYLIFKFPTFPSLKF